MNMLSRKIKITWIHNVNKKNPYDVILLLGWLSYTYPLNGNDVKTKSRYKLHITFVKYLDAQVLIYQKINRNLDWVMRVAKGENSFLLQAHSLSLIFISNDNPGRKLKNSFPLLKWFRKQYICLCVYIYASKCVCVCRECAQTVNN